MGTTAEKLQAILDSKAAIKTAISNKGGSITDSTPLDEYAIVLNNLPNEIDTLINKTISHIQNNNLLVGEYSFFSCTNLETAIFPNATEIGNQAFTNCTGLQSVSFPNVTTIGSSAFISCSGLIGSLNFPNAQTVKSAAFRGCSNVTSITLGTLTGMTIANNIFTDCSNLTEINWTLPPSYSLGSNVFSNCKKMKHFVFTNCTAIGQSVFQGCEELIDVDCGNSASINSNAFYNCYDLTSIILRKSDSICTLSNINAFTNVRGPITIYVPSDLISSYQTATNWSTLYNNSRVTFVAIS